MAPISYAGDFLRPREDIYMKVDRLERKISDLEAKLDALSHNPTFQSVTISNSTGSAILTIADPIRSTVIIPNEITLLGKPGFLSRIRVGQTGNTPVSHTNTFTYTGTWLVWDGSFYDQGNVFVRSNITASTFLQSTN